MISIYELKPKFQKLLRPFVKRLAKAGVTANQVTITAMLLSIATGTFILFYPQQLFLLFLVPVVLFVRMALNAIDGMLAREHNMKSALGNMLNELGDVISDSALYLPFAFLTGISNSLVVAVVILSILSEMTGILGIVIGASRRYDGPMGKSDRAFVFGLVALVLGFGVSAKPWVDYLLMLILILLVVNIINRLVRAVKEVKL